MSDLMLLKLLMMSLLLLTLSSLQFYNTLSLKTDTGPDSGTHPAAMSIENSDQNLHTAEGEVCVVLVLTITEYLLFGRSQVITMHH